MRRGFFAWISGSARETSIFPSKPLDNLSPNSSFPSCSSTATAQAGYTTACNNAISDVVALLPLQRTKINAQSLTAALQSHTCAAGRAGAGCASSSSAAPQPLPLPVSAVPMTVLRTHDLKVTIYWFLTMSAKKGAFYCLLFATGKRFLERRSAAVPSSPFREPTF